MDPSPLGILYGQRKSQEGQTPARPSGPKPPPNLLPPHPVPQLITSMFRRVLTSSRRAGDLLLETLSSDSVHDFSSSSSGRMEEFCEMDLPGAGKAEGFTPAHNPLNPSGPPPPPQYSLGEALLQLEPWGSTVRKTLEGREGSQGGHGTITAIRGQGPRARGVPQRTQWQGGWRGCQRPVEGLQQGHHLVAWGNVLRGLGRGGRQGECPPWAISLPSSLLPAGVGCPSEKPNPREWTNYLHKCKPQICHLSTQLKALFLQY